MTKINNAIKAADALIPLTSTDLVATNVNGQIKLTSASGGTITVGAGTVNGAATVAAVGLGAQVVTCQDDGPTGHRDQCQHRLTDKSAPPTTTASCAREPLDDGPDGDRLGRRCSDAPPPPPPRSGNEYARTWSSSSTICATSSTSWPTTPRSTASTCWRRQAEADLQRDRLDAGNPGQGHRRQSDLGQRRQPRHRFLSNADVDAIPTSTRC